MDQKRSINYPSQFAFLLGLMGAAMILCAVLIGIIGSVVMHIAPKQFAESLLKPENADLSRLLNTIAAFLVFCLPAIIVAKIINKKPFAQLGFTSAIGVKQLLLLFIIIFASLFLSGGLGQLNEWIPLPHDFYVWAKQKEAENKASMMVMATIRSSADYLLALLVLAFCPAVFEEILFRGSLQQIMVGWTKSKWGGIIITSILFSAIHISYFGFLPRVALGVVLGLIFYESKNLWLSILMHFLNNAFIVTQLYIMYRNGLSIDAALKESSQMWWGLFAVVPLFFLFRYFKTESVAVLARRQNKIHSSPENIPS